MPPSCRQTGTGAAVLTLIVLGLGCAPDTDGSSSVDPAAITGELVTYVADFNDGHSEWWHVVRTASGRELRLDFDTPPGVATGSQISVRGEVTQDATGERLRVRAMDVLPAQTIGEAAGEPATYAAPTTDTFALVLVDLGNGVKNVTPAQGQTDLFGAGATDKSFANYYKEVSYGKYQVTGDVIGPFPFSMTTCDTTGMYKAIEPMITGSYNHLIYYFDQTNLCNWGGLGEEGAVNRPAKRTWMNGSLSCTVLMQEPGHNLGLMHANTMKCGTSSFSTTPAQSCTITEYGSTMTTMGSGCKQFNAYERWYMQWLTGCSGVRAPADGTFNLVPLESDCTGGAGIQVLQVPFPATLTVSDPQATSTAVSLNDYYVELRTSGGIFDAYSTSTRGNSVTFTGPTVFVYASDNVRAPTTTGTRGTAPNSVWTELLNMSPSGSTFTGLTAVGQSFADPNGGPTITLQAISSTSATVSVSYPSGGGGTPTCIDGSTPTMPGPTTCGGTVAMGTGGASGSAGAPGTGGERGTGGAGGARATGGATGTGGIATGGKLGTGGAAGGTAASGGATGAETGGSGASGAEPDGTVKGGCACSTDPRAASPFAALGLTAGLGLALLRRRRRA